jgi:hypothetical protein
MPTTLRGSLRGSVLLCFFLAAALGLFAATPNAGQTGPLASAAAGSQATPIAVHGATVNLADTHISMPFRTNGADLVTRGKGAVLGSGTSWRVQHAGRAIQSRDPHYPWVCYMCHLPFAPNP